MAEQRTIEELDLLAYADGFLDGAVAKDLVEEHLRASPELAAKARDYVAQTDALRRAYGSRIQETVPNRLLAILERRTEGRSRNIGAVAAILALIVLSSGAGWLIGQSNSQDEQPSQEFIKLSYDDFVNSIANAQDARLSSSNPRQGQTLNWLSEEVSLRLRVPDLSNQGFSLVDKQTVSDSETQLVRLTYAASDGRSFSLFLKPRWDERKHGLRMATESGVSIAYWLKGPLASAVASHLPPEETLAIAKTVQGALLDLNVARPVIQPEPIQPSQHGPSIAGNAVEAGEDPHTRDGLAAPALPQEPRVFPN